MMKKKFRGVLAAFGATLVAGMMAGCADNPGEPTVQVQGAVLQSAVNGALVFADRTNAGTAFVRDAGEPRGTTNPDGTYSLKVPVSYGTNYRIVSIGGTDTKTGKAASILVAPPAADPSHVRVTPLTTLVALSADQAGMKTKLQTALGVAYDTDISTSANQAAILLVKSIETVLAGVTDTLVAQAPALAPTTPNQTLGLIQKDILQGLAAGVLAADPADLVVPDDLSVVIENGLAIGLQTVDTQGSYVANNVTATLNINANAVAAAVGPAAVDATAGVLGLAGGGTASIVTQVVEATLDTDLLLDAIEDTTNAIPEGSIDVTATTGTGGTGGTGGDGGGTGK